MHKIFFILVAAVPLFLFTGGCGCGSGYSYDNPNEQTINYNVDVDDTAEIMRANIEQQRLYMEQGERAKRDMFRSIDQQFGIPSERSYGHEHHRR